MCWPHLFFCHFVVNCLLFRLIIKFFLLLCLTISPYSFALLCFFDVVSCVTLLSHLVISPCCPTLLCHFVISSYYFTLLHCLVTSPCCFALWHHLANLFCCITLLLPFMASPCCIALLLLFCFISLSPLITLPWYR